LQLIVLTAAISAVALCVGLILRPRDRLEGRLGVTRVPEAVGIALSLGSNGGVGRDEYADHGACDALCSLLARFSQGRNIEGTTSERIACLSVLRRVNRVDGVCQKQREMSRSILLLNYVQRGESHIDYRSVG
jgi:hypothetical protein